MDYRIIVIKQTVRGGIHNEKETSGNIGLDTSHSVEFPRRMQAPDCPEKNKVEGLKAVTCLRFETLTNAEI